MFETYNDALLAVSQQADSQVIPPVIFERVINDAARDVYQHGREIQPAIENAFAQHWGTCAYCGHECEQGDVPAASDDAAWQELAKDHAPDCEWVLTRAHRRTEG